MEIGLQPSAADPCLYVMRRGRNIARCAIYVDDLCISSDSTSLMDYITGELKQRFELTGPNPISALLGCSVNYDREEGICTLSQSVMIRNIHARFIGEGGNPPEVDVPSECIKQATRRIRSTPADATIQELEPLSSDDPEIDEIKGIYASLIGSMLFVASCTRPDISFAISTLSKFNSAPGRAHLTKALQLLGYLNKTNSWVLPLHPRADGVLSFLPALKEGQSRGPLCVLTDASWNSTRPPSGWLVCYDGSSIAWQCRRLTITPLSSAEAEALAASRAAVIAINMRDVHGHMVMDPREVQPPVTIYTDSVSAQALAADASSHRRVKHISIRISMLVEACESGAIKVAHIPGADNVSDLFTKANAGGSIAARHRLRAALVN